MLEVGAANGSGGAQDAVPTCVPACSSLCLITLLFHLDSLFLFFRWGSEVSTITPVLDGVTLWLATGPFCRYLEIRATSRRELLCFPEGNSEGAECPSRSKVLQSLGYSLTSG